MTKTTDLGIRDAAPDDAAQLLSLWGLLFDQATTGEGSSWRTHAQSWFATFVDDRETACFPVIEFEGKVVASAIGTLELGVPNPYCLRGRTVRLANLIVVPECRGRGYATALVEHVVEWARGLNADRVDLSATPEGQPLYARTGFVATSAPRMKLVL